MSTFPLADGSEVRIRPIRPDDKQLLSDGLAHLSPETVYRRFLAPKHSFTRGELRYLTEVDGCDHFALVATRPGPERIVGVARMVRLADDPMSAEVAVVVADSLQGQGLGRELATRIADEARARGIGRFQATFLSSNVPARRLMERIAERVAAGPPQGATVELTADLVRAA